MLLVHGVRDRSEEAWQRAAWITAHLLQPWTESPISPQQLLTPPASGELEHWLDPAAAFDALVKRQQAIRG